MRSTSSGYTTLEEGTVKAWCDALPDPEARANLERFAVSYAAGIVAEDMAKKIPNATRTQVAEDGDVQEIVQIAGYLGIGFSTAEPAVVTFIEDAYAQARDLLVRSDVGAAWNRVGQALYAIGRLTGDEVRALVEEVAEDG